MERISWRVDMLVLDLSDALDRAALDGVVLHGVRVVEEDSHAEQLLAWQARVSVEINADWDAWELIC